MPGCASTLQHQLDSPPSVRCADRPQRPLTLCKSCNLDNTRFSVLAAANERASAFSLQALKELEYPEKLQRLLLTPQREVLVELVITKDNGEIETFNAYRVQHDDSRGPYKGGLRYHPQVDLDDVRRWGVLLLHPSCGKQYIEQQPVSESATLHLYHVLC